MVSLIKNQLFKHLSKFTKNLSAENFNFSALKGEGELTDLQLDEIVLTDLLELPCWLRLTSAWCNRVSFRIQWAKLKSVPIQLNLDEVHVEVETCEELRSTSSSQGLSSYAGAAKYSFIHKAIDGMTVTVNTVLVKFRSPAFTSSVELSRIVVESKSPEWKKVELPRTRVKDSAKGHVLLFKELEWQNVRIEARATKDPNLTPLRLITNRATCRIVLKKRIRDSFIMGSRLVVTLDDLLWVLTDFQLKAALHFLDSLAGLIQKATELTRKRKAARKLEELPEYQSQQAQQARAQEQNQMSESGQSFPQKKTEDEKFAKIDVVETSYHFIAHKIDLHICDDNADGRSTHPDLQKGGSMQVALRCFQVDFYPYHLAVGDRHHWPMYREANSYHTEWLRTAQQRFTSNLLNHAQTFFKCSESQDSQNTALTPNLVRSYIRRQLSMLMTSCFILRLADFTINQVTTSGLKKHIPKEFISGDKERYHLPSNSPILHAEFTYYYYPNDEPFPLPTPKFCVHLDPIQLHFDVTTLLWVNAFALSLHQSLLQTSAAGNDAMVSSIMSFDVQIVAINCRVSFDALDDHPGQRDRPKSLHVQVSRASICNVSHSESGFRDELDTSVNSFQLASLFYHSEFPSAPEDERLQVDAFSQLCAAMVPEKRPPQTISTFADVRSHLMKDVKWNDRKEVWCVSLDSVSASFHGARATGSQNVAFLDNLPVTVWLRLKVVPELDVQALAHISSLVSLQINHYQFLFLLRLAERLTDLTNHLSTDSARILKKESEILVVVGAVVPQIEITLLMPSQTPGKSSSGGDVESFIPDSSSLQDDNWHSSSSAVNEKAKTSDEHIRFSDIDPIEKTANGIVKPAVPKDLPIKIPNEPDVRESRRLSVGHISFTEETGTAIWELRRVFKKGVGNIMASLDITGNQSPDEMSSTLSLKSDPSTDSDNYIHISGDIDPMESMYCNITAVEEAAECLEDEITVTSPSEKDSFTNSMKRHDLVSICTFKLRKVEAGFQLRGPSSVLKAEVGQVTAGECASIPWDEFQCKFNTRHRGWPESMGPPPASGSKQIMLRLTRTTTSELPEADVRINGIRLELNMSSIAGLVDLVEDEMRPVPLPAKILLEDIRLRLNDDRPATHITSIEAMPTDVVVHHLVVRRDSSGLIEIPAPEDVSHSNSQRTLDDDALLRRLQNENDDMRRRLAALERLTEENYRLKRYQVETEGLRSCLTDAQNRVAALLEDKKSLLDNVRVLQGQLSLSERNNKR